MNPFEAELGKYEKAPETMMDRIPCGLQEGICCLANVAFGRIRKNGGRDALLLSDLEGLGSFGRLAAQAIKDSDAKHTAQVVTLATCMEDQLTRHDLLVLLAALVEHDSDFPPTREHSTHDARQQHMDRARTVLPQDCAIVNANLRDDFFEPSVVNAASELVGCHDNHSLKPPKMFLRSDPLFDLKLIHRQFDRLGMIVGVETDVLRKFAKCGSIESGERNLRGIVCKQLAHNVRRFLEEGSLIQQANESADIELRMFHGLRTIFHCDTAFYVFLNQLQRKLDRYGVPMSDFKACLDAEIAGSSMLA